MSADRMAWSLDEITITRAKKGKRSWRPRLRYSEDQPRDEHGRFGSGGGGKESAPVVAGGTSAVTEMMATVPDHAGVWNKEAREGEATLAWHQANGAEGEKYQATINEWTETGSSTMSKDAISGSTQAGRDLAGYLDVAPQETGPIFRGTSLNDFTGGASLQPGSEFQLAPSSFSRSESEGGVYASKVGAGNNPVVLEVQPGARAAPLMGLSKYPEEREVISGGHFTVVSRDSMAVPQIDGSTITVPHVVVSQAGPILARAVRSWWRPTRPLTPLEEGMSGSFAAVRGKPRFRSAQKRRK